MSFLTCLLKKSKAEFSLHITMHALLQCMHRFMCASVLADLKSQRRGYTTGNGQDDELNVGPRKLIVILRLCIEIIR